MCVCCCVWLVMAAAAAGRAGHALSSLLPCAQVGAAGIRYFLDMKPIRFFDDVVDIKGELY